MVSCSCKICTEERALYARYIVRTGSGISFTRMMNEQVNDCLLRFVDSTEVSAMAFSWDKHAPALNQIKTEPTSFSIQINALFLCVCCVVVINTRGHRTSMLRFKYHSVGWVFLLKWYEKITSTVSFLDVQSRPLENILQESVSCPFDLTTSTLAFTDDDP